MSDRDILIVDDNVKVLNDRARVLKEAGWSVASYTFAKLNALCGRGALFIQHIKLESSIVIDRRGRLAKALKTFRPRRCYAEEIRDNGLLASLAGEIPFGAKGALFAADVLYVTVRNFGVLSLAERGIHAYAFGSVVEALETERLIAPGGARALAALRFLKCLYRAGETGTGVLARTTVEQALEALPPIHFPREVRIVPPKSILLAPVPSASSPAYFQLRNLERRLVALQTFERSQTCDEELRTLLRWIENPRAYAGLSPRLGPELCRVMAESFLRCQGVERLAVSKS